MQAPRQGALNDACLNCVRSVKNGALVLRIVEPAAALVLRGHGKRVVMIADPPKFVELDEHLNR